MSKDKKMTIEEMEKIINEHCRIIADDEIVIKRGTGMVELLNQEMNELLSNKDEKKMIEDMARNLCGRTHKCDDCLIFTPICGYKSYCKTLFNVGYRKVADDEIVIKKSGYAALVNDLDKGDYGEFENGFSQGYEQAKQETAREILQEMKAKCKELENKYSHLCKSKKECLMETCRYQGVLAVKRELYDLAKKHGIELE